MRPLRPAPGGRRNLRKGIIDLELRITAGRWLMEHQQ